jgi:hypothetical protein
VVTAAAPTSRPPKRRRLLRFFACVCVGLLLTVPLYVGLALSGVIRSPFFPRADGDIALAKSDQAGVRVLFVGNSFTFYNDMPAMVHELAAADRGAPDVFSVEYTAPAWSLRKASGNDGLEDLMADVPWDVVVLQERSAYLSFSREWWGQETLPFALELRHDIAADGAETVVFMTWGYEHGNGSGDSYDGMQARIAAGYEELADLLAADVAPVGLAWAAALRDRPDLDLWRRDGHHPTRAGSFLAACVFYRELTGRDPLGSDYFAGLAEDDARFLQRVAGDTVDEYEATREGRSARPL